MPYKSTKAILGQAGSPVQQGPDTITSLETNVYDEIVRIPISETDNCVIDPLEVPLRFPTLFHRMPKGVFFRAKLCLQDRFETGGSPVAQWSVNVAAPTGLPNSLPLLGTVLKVTGGVGIGAVVYECTFISTGESSHLDFLTSYWSYNLDPLARLSTVYNVVVSYSVHVLPTPLL